MSVHLLANDPAERIRDAAAALEPGLAALDAGWVEPVGPVASGGSLLHAAASRPAATINTVRRFIRPPSFKLARR